MVDPLAGARDFVVFICFDAERELGAETTND
jgi:hypothetical protein